jgi:hypothetical protein
MSPVGFEPTIQASKQVKIVHAVDHSDTVTGITFHRSHNFLHVGKSSEYPSRLVMTLTAGPKYCEHSLIFLIQKSKIVTEI